MMIEILEAQPLAGYRIRLVFADGASGEVDLSHLVGKGVFKYWDQAENFKNVSVINGRWLAWSDEIDLDADTLYLKLTGKQPDFPFSKKTQLMPEISRFYGIVIRMFYDDHNPPHFHAFYGSDEAWVTINTLAVFHGNLPSRALGMVIEWASLHQDELRRNWALMGEEAKPKKIAPLR